MKDGFEATFVVELAADEVWEALAKRAVDGGRDSRDDVHYVLPGFPSFEPIPMAGASCSPVEIEPGRLLRVRKDHEPCAGTEIAVTLEQEGTGTRITVVQSGFGAWLDRLRDTAHAHWVQIVADLHLYLERGITVPGTVWGASLGAEWRRTPVGLEILRLDPGGFGESAGLETGDLLLTVRGIRVHDTQQLWTILALCEPGTDAEITWARGRQPMRGKATFAAGRAPSD